MQRRYDNGFIHLREVADLVSLAFERVSRAKRARIEATDAMAAETQSGYRYVNRGVASTSRNIETSSTRILSDSSSMTVAMEQYHSAAVSHISGLRQATHSIVEDGAKEDRPTGTTPRKRSWNYVDEWELTGSREALLKERRRRGISNACGETFLAEHLPLPEEEAPEDGVHEGMLVDEEPEAMDEPEDSENVPPSEDPPPSFKSSSSSTSSSSTATSTTLPQQTMFGIKKLANGPFSKSGLPIKGTLTERPANVIVARNPRRTQR